MKYVYKTLLALGVILLFNDCSKYLDEEPRSLLTPDYFNTPAGFEAGVNAAYSGMRYLFGSEGYAYMTCAGTDESQRGRDGNLSFHAYDAGLNAQDGNLTGPWNRGYTFINTCNGVIAFGERVEGIDAAKKSRLIAEAKFLRAFYYFILVRQFGDVTLNLDLVSEPTTAAVRAPVAEVYEAMVKDLTEAIPNLPDKPAPTPGRAGKAAAKHLLAQIYLTRGWSAAAKSSDFADAYATATDIITNKAAYGLDLWQDFADVFKQGNDYGKEVIFVIEHNADPAFSESIVNNSPAIENGLKENRSNYFWRNLYQEMPGMQRDIANGRPFLRLRPTDYTLDIAFGERANDSRYDKTFQTVWYCNLVPNAKNLVLGDTAIWMPGTDRTDAEIAAARYTIIPPRKYGPTQWPSQRKFDDTKRLAVNDPSTRPYIVFKLSETYLIAAEAAMKMGNNDNAATHLNTIRQRAAYRASNTADQNTAAAAAMTITAGDVDVDLILDERCREFYGEYHRWYDLARTGTLIQRVQQYNPNGGANIKAHHVLRPIPQAQIDLVTTGPKYPQNPGY